MVDHVHETRGEEIANSITHGVGAALSVAALVTMIVIAVSRGTNLQVVGCTVYGISLVLLYLCSTVYHALEKGRAKQVFRILDHSSIYLLIAGTYTPFTLVTLRGVLGWGLFGVVWAMALSGVVFKCYFTGRLHALSTTVYIVMGWIAVVATRPLFQALPLTGFLLVLAGGVFYTSGVVFFARDWKYAHMIWHIFVLAGSVCHFLAIFLYVLPRPA